tara:strand:+ start:5780 stop:6640 length:861 start_codon:yes stop_codon:yes gene_type:complete
MKIYKSKNGISYLSKGRGDPLYLLHGFPDTPINFHNQINFFAQNGFEVFVPYLPGYHKDDKELDTYQTLRISELIIDFIECTSQEKSIYLFGHDWGAPISYGISQLRPDLLLKMSTSSVPHGLSVQTSFLNNGDQQRKSWYMFFFQLPVADFAIPVNNYDFIHRLWREWSPDWDEYKKYSDEAINCLKQGEVLSRALSYYRATFQPQLQIQRLITKTEEISLQKIKTPTLYFHGLNDGCMGHSLIEGMEVHFDKLVIKIMDDCGHFLHLEKTEEFNKTLLKFFREN